MTEYTDALRDAVRANVEAISGTDIFVTLYHERMADFIDDPLPAIQLAIAILLDKPIIVAALPGRLPPKKLLAIADHIVYGSPEEISRNVADYLKSGGH